MWVCPFLTFPTPAWIRLASWCSFKTQPKNGVASQSGHPKFDLLLQAAILFGFFGEGVVIMELASGGALSDLLYDGVSAEGALRGKRTAEGDAPRPRKFEPSFRSWHSPLQKGQCIVCTRGIRIVCTRGAGSSLHAGLFCPGSFVHAVLTAMHKKGPHPTPTPPPPPTPPQDPTPSVARERVCAR